MPDTKETKLQMPVCPYCKTIMKTINYQGFYDVFSFWRCECIHFENGEFERGEDCGL